MKKNYLFWFVVLVLTVSSLLAVPVLKAADKSKINVAIGAKFPQYNMDPASMGGGEAAGFYNIFEYLIGFDKNHKMIGLLADSWSTSRDGKALTVKLKKNVKFSTGDPFTAKDVIFSFERNMKNNFRFQDQVKKETFDHAEIVDDYTVKFIFPIANVQFLPQALSLLAITSQDQYNKLGEKKFKEDCAGTGPYKVTGWTKGSVKLGYNEYFHGKKPQVTEAEFFYVFDPSTKINMLLAGEVDIIDQTEWTQVDRLEKSGYKKVNITSPHAVALQFQLYNKNTPWANKKVRYALNYCINKEIAIQKLFNNVPQLGTWQFSWEQGYNKSLKPAFPYDLKKAKQLMKEAGYEKGFEMPIYYMTDAGWSKNLVDYLTTSLMQIGIKCKLTGLSFGPDFFIAMRKFGQEKDSEATVLCAHGWPGNAEPVMNLTLGFYSKNPVCLYSTPELDSIINKALVTVNEKNRIKLVRQAYEIINDDMPFIPIMIEANVFMMKNNIEYKQTLGDMNNNPANLFELRIK